MNLDLEKKVRKEVLLNKILRDYGLWLELDLDIPTPLDIYEKHDIPIEEDYPEPVLSTFPGISIIYSS